MKTKFSGILTLLLAFVVQISFAQTTVSGTVSEENGPLPGASVLIKGTTTGTQTDFDGNYSITANPTDVLVFSYVGYATQEITAGIQSVLNVTLAADNALDEVIVTASGVKREKKALGFAVTTLDAESVEQKPESDLVRSLNGKIAGVQITGNSGATGSGTQFLIRGASSINGGNAPLFVVDGVPFEGGAVTNGANFTTGSTTTSNRFLDLDPNNIESISVLKGLNAAVLYGQQGRNGVVLVTTKSGSSKDRSENKKLEVTINAQSYITQISNLPDYQNEYGQGAGNIFNSGFVGNFGSRFDSLDEVPHPYNADANAFDQADAFPEFQGLFIPYEAVEDNVSNFFRDGFGSALNININGPSDGRSRFNLNVGYTDEDGFIPENNLRRYNISVGGGTQLTNKLSFDASILYSDSRVDTPPIAANNGGASSVFTRTLFIPRNIDLNNLPFQNPITGQSVYYRTDQTNPLWLVNNSRNRSDTRRTFSRLSTRYDFSDTFSLSYRFGLDTFNTIDEFRINRGSVEQAALQAGYLRINNSQNTIIDQNLTFTANDISLGGKVKFNGLLGSNIRRDAFSRNGTAHSNQIVFDVFTERNFVDQTNNDPVTGLLDFESFQNVLGVFSELNFDYDDYLYLSLSGRNDWASTVEEDNRSLFYPGASLSFVPTSVDGIGTSEAVNFLKVRTAYGTSARFPGPFNTQQTLGSNPNIFVDSNGNGTSTNSAQGFLANPDLRPELQEEIEIGVEGGFLRNRITLDASIYRRTAEDQILNQPLASATGFTNTLINAGTVRTDGIEIGLNFIPIKTDNFTYSITNNFTALDPIVTQLNVEPFAFSGFGNLGNFAAEGEPLGVIRGSFALRDDNGNLLINATDGKIIDSNDLGLPIETIGDPNPDWNLTSIHSFAWKGVTLSAQFEYQQGGDIFSQTITQLLRRGVTEDTAIGRENTFILPGILADPNTGEPLLDGAGNTIPNNVQISHNNIFFINLVDPAGQGIYDASHFRIREVSLGYTVPEKFLEKTPFGQLAFTLAGQNLFVDAFNTPDGINFDPEQLSTGGNGRGLEFQTGPTSRRFSFNVKASF